LGFIFRLFRKIKKLRGELMLMESLTLIKYFLAVLVGFFVGRISMAIQYAAMKEKIKKK